MASLSKLCLNFPNFQSHMATEFKISLENGDFCDITLVCEDGQQMDAHRVILAASSEVFKEMLRRNNHPRAFIFVRGLKEKYLSALLEYIYNGEVTVLSEDLQDFLDLSEDLKIKGLMEVKEEYFRMTKTNISPLKLDLMQISKASEDTQECSDVNMFNIVEDQTNVNTDQEDITSFDMKTKDDEMRGSCDNISSNHDKDAIKSKVNSMHEKVGKGKGSYYICNVCGKKSTDKSHSREHIETHHIEGLLFSCSGCNLTSKCSFTVKAHISKRKKLQQEIAKLENKLK